MIRHIKNTQAYRNWMRRRRRRAVRAAQIREIFDVEKALLNQGNHPRVSPVIARWFRIRGFECSSSQRQEGWFTVWGIE